MPWAHRALNMIWRWLFSDFLRTNGRPISDPDGLTYLFLYGLFFKHFYAFLRHQHPIYMTSGHDADV